ncbi:MAG: hypothetical protein ACREBR_04355 [bacterium]
MAIRQVKEVNRSVSYPIASGNIVGGNLLQLNALSQLLPWVHTQTTGKPYGLAIESNIFFPLQPANGEVAGQGFDYTNFNRGGLESVYLDGGDFVLYNDGRGFPYDATATYAINQPVYASATVDGLITSDPTSTVIVGYVVSFDVAVAPQQLEIKSII